jgi:hypothetical protein
VSNLTEIGRLIEAGLTLYGLGDLDGALDSWEQALEMDPDNAQANSYVEYVRHNYELLSAEVAGESLDPSVVPFAIGEDEYQVEVIPGDPIPNDAPMTFDPTDQGWYMDDENAPRRQRMRTAAPPPTTDSVALQIELEAEEPLARKPISFEDETAEYPGGPPKKKPNDSQDPITQEFRPDSTPGLSFELSTPPGGYASQLTPGFETTTSGFGSQVTDIRKRETGFVQPIASKRPPSEDLQISIRTEEESPGGASSAEIELSYDDPPAPSSTEDLLDSLPVPTPAPTYLPPVQTTRDLPPPTRKPAPTGAPPEPSRSDSRDFASAQTAELPGVRFHMPAQRDIATRDLPNLPRTPTPAIDLPPAPQPLVSAPTRDLGLRPPSKPPPVAESQASPVDDEPTKLRRPSRDSTHPEDVLPFDPIDARTTQILKDVDSNAPDLETKEDRTRRRISTLFERAVEWSKGTEIDRAVAAIDLALSEDPNSALAQKLIHRNRETMMTVFQQFLGDLNRQPALARPLHELAAAPISPRAAFLLSRVDGTLTLDEILDVSGMPRIEAYRYLCQLFLRGILR